MTKKSKRIEIDKEAQLVWEAEEEERLNFQGANSLGARIDETPGGDLALQVLRMFDGRVAKQEEEEKPTPKKRGGQTHEGLRRGDRRYLEKSKVRELGDPVEILNDTFSHQDQMIPGYPKKKKLHSWDLITFLGYYGAEKFLGHSLASFLPKLLVFKHDNIFVSSRSLLAQCGMSQQSKKLVSKLFRPWCLRCCAGGSKCGPDRHDWQPPLFFRERKLVKKSRHYRTFLRPNRGAFHVLVVVLVAAHKQTVEEFHVPVEEKAEKYEEKKRRASHAREAKGKK